MKIKSCENCEHSKISGKYYPETRETPAEYPDVECDYQNGEYEDIQKYFDLIDYIEDRSQTSDGFRMSFDDETRAKYCPFYEGR